MLLPRPDFKALKIILEIHNGCAWKFWFFSWVERNMKSPWTRLYFHDFTHTKLIKIKKWSTLILAKMMKNWIWNMIGRYIIVYIQPRGSVWKKHEKIWESFGVLVNNSVKITKWWLWGKIDFALELESVLDETILSTTTFFDNHFGQVALNDCRFINQVQEFHAIHSLWSATGADAGLLQEMCVGIGRHAFAQRAIAAAIIGLNSQGMDDPIPFVMFAEVDGQGPLTAMVIGSVFGAGFSQWPSVSLDGSVEKLENKMGALGKISIGRPIFKMDISCNIPDENRCPREWIYVPFW